MILNILSFLFLKNYSGGCVIIRRPAPIFYYFSLIFSENVPEEIPEIEFCRDLMSFDEEDYINKLIARSKVN